MSLRVLDVGKTYLPPPWYLKPFARVASDEPVDALRNVTFDVAPGEIVGLVGPNGAGKTTLLKIISTLLEPTTGRVFIDDIDIARSAHEARMHLGLVLTEDRSTYWRLTGRQNLEFFGVLAGLPRAEARQQADELLTRVGLGERDKLVMGYSSGMRSALNIARAVVGAPSLLVLDEPTRSLDPLASLEMAQLLRDQAAEGRSVLLSSHRMDEVAMLCDRVVVIIDGAVRYLGSPGGGTEGSQRLLKLLTEDVPIP